MKKPFKDKPNKKGKKEKKKDMAITCTPEITTVIHNARREITMSIEFSDDANGGDIRTLSGTGKALTQAEGRHLMDSIIERYLASREHEDIIATIKTEMEANAKIYLEAQLNG